MKWGEHKWTTPIACTPASPVITRSYDSSFTRRHSGASTIIFNNNNNNKTHNRTRSWQLLKMLKIVCMQPVLYIFVFPTCDVNTSFVSRNWWRHYLLFTITWTIATGRNVTHTIHHVVDLDETRQRLSTQWRSQEMKGRLFTLRWPHDIFCQVSQLY